MYKPPYPTQAFHYGSRHMGPSHTPPAGPGPAPSPAPMPHPGAESAHGHPRAPAPYGLISDLPLPVPTGDSQVQRIIYTSGLVEGSGDSISNIKTLTAKRSKRLAFRLKYLSLQTDRPCSDNYVVSCLYYHCLFQAGLNGHIYKMPEIPESFPELCDMKYSIPNILDMKSILIEIWKLSFGSITFMSLFLSPLTYCDTSATFCCATFQSNAVVKHVWKRGRVTGVLCEFSTTQADHQW